MIQDFEDTIIDTLKSVVNGSVKAYPQNPNKYFLQSAVGEVLVRYAGRSPKETDLAGALIRQEYIFEIVFVYRNLRGDKGVYTALNKAYETLQGAQVAESAKPLEFNDERFLDENNGVWQFGQKWKFINSEINTIKDGYSEV